MDETVIVGAGISGLECALKLTGNGKKVTVLEKSRGLFGRFSARRINGQDFFKGVNGFEFNQPAIAELFKQCIDSIKNDHIDLETKEEFLNNLTQSRVVFNFKNTKIRDQLKERYSKINVLKSTRLIEIIKNEDVSELVLEEFHPTDPVIKRIKASRVVFALPVPQVLNSIKGIENFLNGQDLNRYQNVKYHKDCLICFSDKGKVSEALNLKELEMVRLSSQQDIGIFRYKDSIAESLESKSMALELLGEIGIHEDETTHIHFWRYSQVSNSIQENFGKFGDHNLYLIGDSFGGGGFNGAYLSGITLAKHLLEF